MSDFAHAPATIKIGDLEARRLGYGAMRLPGKDVWGEPDDPKRAIAVVRRAIELGVNLIDTAWYYGPFVANRILAEALHPYPRDLVLVTKLGGKRNPDKSWASFARPEELREGMENDLRSLKVDRIDVVHLRLIGNSGVPFLESLDAMIAMQKEGKLRHIGLSVVSSEQLEQALARTPIVTVSNMFSVGGGGGMLAKMTHSEVDDPDAVLSLCEKRGIAFLPYFPLLVGGVEKQPGLAAVAKRHGKKPAQIALAWLLARSKVMLPIPGTSSPAHLEENWEARRIQLSKDDLETIARG